MTRDEINKMWEAYQSVVSEKKKLDPVNDKENDKKFKDRKDKDIDNDGDVDSSDQYLHKRRKATDDAIDGGDKPAKESCGYDKKKMKESDDEEGETDMATSSKSDDSDSGDDDKSDTEKKKKSKKKPEPKDGEETKGKAEISKINVGEDFKRDVLDALEDALSATVRESKKSGDTRDVETVTKEPSGKQVAKATQKQMANDTASKAEKDFVAKHKVDAIPHDDLEKIEEPKDRKVKKEMTEFEVIQALLSGKPFGD